MGLLLRRFFKRFEPRHPAQFIVLGFAGAIAAGTALLLLPVSKAGNGGATFIEALFTATSAVCVTGLIVVDTPVYWTPFGHGIILIMIAVGGFGIMTFASLLGVLLSRKLGLVSRVSTAAETKSVGFGDVKQVVLGVLKISLIIEALTAAVLTARFYIRYEETWGDALWLGIFHSVSAFNNAGFALYSDSLMRFVGDPWICLPIAAAVILGGLGFPVLFELRRRYRVPRHWSMNTKLVISGTVALLFIGTIFISVIEWNNPATMGRLPTQDKVLAGFLQSVLTRTAGFNSLDITAMHPVTWLGMDILMFIGGGPAGTAGGLKITTFGVLFFIMYAEIRGETAVNVFGKRLSRAVHRQALTIVLLSVGLLALSTMALMLITELRLDRVLFEVVSAFATVGMSTGITAAIPSSGQLILVMLMFVGRLGPITFATALALRHRPRLYEYPKERPIIG
ncbi:TrkH family potassium uptake protein [Arthrobacter sp. H14]|uniref:TrkH family potassium uptake protein n=1 Tax=Arthrobacter sp. H14 TaxID=1312959 RepID=UPI0020A6C12D|nr:potassium transporter TrkG [Arthrobacter sp. H14]